VLEPLDGQTAGGRPLTTITVPPDSDPSKCQRTVTVRALGRWRITVYVTDSAHVTASAATEVTFRDLLIAAVGDSFTSGEGGKPNNGHWADAQCDRSMTPWPKLLAELVEDRTTTVTYLNYACSGADASSVATDFYGGIRYPGPPAPKLKPQIQALRDDLGDPLAPTTREVNLLLGSFGINEMGGAKGVSTVLGACVNITELAVLFVTRIPPFDCEQDLSGDIARLKELYDTIELATSARLKLGHVHVIGYPARVFTNSADQFEGCGVFSGMDGSETRWITDSLNGIDREVAQAALSNGWSFTATTDIFRHHGYCADDLPAPFSGSWFHTPFESYHRQGNRNGTIHPTKSGHRATAQRVRKNVVLDEPAPSPARLRVHFLRVRVSHRGPLRQWTKDLSLGVSPYPSPCGVHARLLSSLTLNQWKDVSADPCYDYDITTVGRTIGVSALTFLFRPGGKRPEPRVPPNGQPAAYASRADPEFYFPVRRLHRRRDGWDATSPTGAACVLQHAAGVRKSPQPGDRSPVVMEIDYQIATSGPLGLAPCAPVHLPG
jgi:hypothetical protein